jgi:signal transduction histidine kinase
MYPKRSQYKYALQASPMNDRHLIFDFLPGCYLILSPQAPEFLILDVNAAYLTVSHTTRAIVGKPLFEVFPDNPDDLHATGVKNLTASLERVLKTKQPHEMAIQRYDTRRPEGDGFTIRYWKPANIPVLTDDGSIKYIIHTVEDVTNLMLLRRGIRHQNSLNQHHIKDAILTTQEMERMEVSQELHDNVNQILHTARLYLEKATHTSTAQKEFLKCGHALVEKAIDEVKELSYSLRHFSKEERQLTEVLEEILGQIGALNHVNITKSIELPDESLIESKVKTTIIRILQEQLTNVVKHADAKNVYIEVNFKDGNLELTIKDDGKGFDMKKVKSGQGFQNIKSRAAIMDGRVLITSYPGDGCIIQVFLPVN